MLLWTHSFLLIVLIHLWRTSWSLAHPKNLCKAQGLRHRPSSWSKNLCISHLVLFPKFKFSAIVGSERQKRLKHKIFNFLGELAFKCAHAVERHHCGNCTYLTFSNFQDSCLFPTLLFPDSSPLDIMVWLFKLLLGTWPHKTLPFSFFIKGGQNGSPKQPNLQPRQPLSRICTNMHEYISLDWKAMIFHFW